MQSPSIAQRAALYLRVSTARQAEHDISIPDQRKQGEAYCVSRGYEPGRYLCGSWRYRDQ